MLACWLPRLSAAALGSRPHPARLLTTTVVSSTDVRNAGGVHDVTAVQSNLIPKAQMPSAWHSLSLSLKAVCGDYGPTN